jgi:hypothetical protein
MFEITPNYDRIAASPPRMSHALECSCLFCDIAKLRAALERIGTDRSLSRAECAVIAAEAVESIEL